MTAGFIREVYYLEWLANVVMVKKSNGNGACVLNLQTSTMVTQRIAFHFPRLTS